MADLLGIAYIFTSMLAVGQAMPNNPTITPQTHTTAINTISKTTLSDNDSDLRIVSLSPHLTELVYAIGRGKQLIATSDYSDYPEQAQNLPSVASYQGANIAEIIRLQPTHVLVWRGGNKDADIQKLSLLGFEIFESRILSLSDLQKEIIALGTLLHAQDAANTLANKVSRQLTALKSEFVGQSQNVIYYMSTQPFIGLGSDPWLNDVLKSCGLKNIYADALSSYPALQISDVLRQQPDLVIAAGKYSMAEVKDFWQNHNEVFSPKFIISNPDAMHRFTPRSVQEITKVCRLAYQHNE